jgi:serine-type D-Ala-D-Ala carboxypeptidase/endopeptidase (penicillin-binding protein 4)
MWNNSRSRYFLVFIVGILGLSCASIKPETRDAGLVAIEQKHKNHLGLHVQDLSGNKVLSYQADRLFTPASNLKILSTYLAASLLKDSTIAFKYSIKNDSLCIQPQGDPSLMYPDFSKNAGLSLLEKAKYIQIDTTVYQGQKYNMGWAWEDYAEYFMCEINAMPLYGNHVRIKNKNIEPAYFEPQLKLVRSDYLRAENQNLFYVTDNSEQLLPLKLSHTLSRDLLTAALKKEVKNGQCPNAGLLQKGMAIDTLIRKLMYESDNMLAEQMLLQCADALDTSLSSSAVIKKAQNQGLLSRQIRMVDGSGLSRYNLISPEQLVEILNKFQQEVGLEKLKTYLPQVGVQGTMKNGSKTALPIYAKSGSLGGIYCMSGIYFNKNSEARVFSFMSNNSVGSIRTVKNDMIAYIIEMSSRED